MRNIPDIVQNFVFVYYLGPVVYKNSLTAIFYLNVS